MYDETKETPRRIKSSVKAALALTLLALILLALWLRFADQSAEPEYTIEHSLIIDAPIAQVWAVLSDFSRYGEWNTYLPKVSGVLAPGEVLDVQLVQGELGTAEKPLALTPTLVHVDPGRAFAWEGILGVRGIHDTYHAFELHDLGDGKTRVHQYEEFRGLAPWLMKRDVEEAANAGEGEAGTMQDETRNSFQTMNTLLRDRVLQ